MSHPTWKIDSACLPGQEPLQRALTHRRILTSIPAFLRGQRAAGVPGRRRIDFLSGEYLYHRFPELPEGPLTTLRSALVRRETLADFAQDLKLGRYLLMGYGEAESGGRERPTVLADAFEALAGAIYLDQGLDALQRFFQPFMEKKVASAQRDEANKDPKSRLQELAQSHMRYTPRYRTMSENGPDHAKEFTVQVTIGDRTYGQGTGHSKQLAAQAAAQDALQRIEAEGLDLNGDESHH